MKELLQLIEERQSVRMPFDPEHRVSKEDIEMILEAGRWTPRLIICKTLRSSLLMIIS